MTSNYFNNPTPRGDDPRRSPADPMAQPPAAPNETPAIFAQEPTPTGYLPEGAQEAEPQEDSQTTQAVKEAGESAKQLAQEGRESASTVVNTAKAEASMVAEQAKDKAANLLEELGGDVREQAAIQQQKVAANLRDISEEFRSMLDNSQASGTASMLVDQAAQHSSTAAQWLDSREPGDLVDEVKHFARKRPGTFLGIAVAAGLLAGRITRNAGGSKQSSEPREPSPVTPAPIDGGPTSQRLPSGTAQPVDASLPQPTTEGQYRATPRPTTPAGADHGAVDDSGLGEPNRSPRTTDVD